MLKIRIIKKVPVEDKHGVKVGRVFDAIISPTEIPKKKYSELIGYNAFGEEVYEEKVIEDKYDYFYRGRNYFWVQGDAGEAVKIWGNECEVIEEDE